MHPLQAIESALFVLSGMLIGSLLFVGMYFMCVGLMGEEQKERGNKEV